MLVADGYGRTMQARVNALVIVTGYRPADPAFQFPQRHAGGV